MLLEYHGANVLQARYTHGPGIDEPLAVTKGGSTFFYHQDGLGTVTDLTDSAGTTAKSYSYDAYGNIMNQAGTLDQPYTYTGREFDSESGLMYYWARYYNPTTGRFLQIDPQGVDQEIHNLYAYVESDPINYVDPYGEIRFPWPKPRPKPPSKPNPGPDPKGKGGNQESKGNPDPQRICKLSRPPVPPGGFGNPCSPCWSCTYQCSGKGIVGGGMFIHRYQIGGCVPAAKFVAGFPSPTACDAAAKSGRKDNPLESLYPGDEP